MPALTVTLGAEFGAVQQVSLADVLPLGPHVLTRFSFNDRKEHDRAMAADPPQYCSDCGSPLEQRKGLDGDRPAPHRRTSVAISPARSSWFRS